MQFFDLIFVINFLNILFVKVNSVKANYLFLDNELHEQALDSEQCKNQLRYLRENNTLLLAEFLDAGLRVPKGIFTGNLRDFGLFEKCLSIHDKTNIHGKYCSIKVPVFQKIRGHDMDNLLKDVLWDFNSLQVDSVIINELNEQRKYIKDEMKGEVTALYNWDTRTLHNRVLPGLTFDLALCLPKTCTTQEFVFDLLLNYTASNFQYEDIVCRLPNDKPFGVAQYTATVVFSLIGLLTLLSTSYDVYHNDICKRDPKAAKVLLMSFSALKNCREVLTIKANPKAIQCLDGIRALATFWVLIGHVFLIYSTDVANQLDILKWYTSYKSIWILTAPITVDTFFFLSGFLLIFTTYGKITPKKSVICLPLLFIYRVMRMFPVLAVVILFEVSFLNFVGDGPSWLNVMGVIENCRNNWWSTLLYVQNYVNPTSTCLGVTWYLGIDVNLHLITTILFIFLLGRRKSIVIAGIIVISLTSLIASAVYVFTHPAVRENYLVNYYVNIITRAPPFFIGILYGYAMKIIQEKEMKMKIPHIINIIITVLSLVLMGSVVYLYYENEAKYSNDLMAQKALDSFLRPMWSLGLGCIICVCSNGYGGPINWILSLNVWKIPSRISYSIYLFHMSFIYAVYGNVQQQMIFNLRSIMFQFMAFFAIALVVAFFLTALIDTPFSFLFKYLFENIMTKAVPKESNKKSKHKVVNSNEEEGNSRKIIESNL